MVIVSMVICFTTACTREEVDIERDCIYFSEPDIAKLGLLSYNYSDILGFDMETDYSSITAYVSGFEFPVDFEQITITVVNENPGKAFWLFSVPYIKHQKGSETILLPFNARLQLDAYGEHDLWGTCGTVGNKTESNKTQLTLSKDNYVYNFVPGNYLICVYVGERTIEIPIVLK